eukprot:TRINITY_DN32030_c0_g1_i1.p1 TRINITY_DN32030_c0_g1~~TRINITY_DN32030_c0_g1_i1.p1  ORF type:complete len:332 (+),score=55.67 TRINITY_DN32030_c0_g1_i1:137-1132(+)
MPSIYKGLRGYGGLQASRDIIDHEIKELCNRWPAILEDNTIIRKAHGRYRINGREVCISLSTREATREDDNESDASCADSRGVGFEAGPDSDDLIVRDGPLSQPFLDYVFDTGRAERYATQSLDLVHASKPFTRTDSQRLEPEFKGGLLDAGPRERLVAMSLAREEANFEWPDDDLGEVPVMPPPPSLPWTSSPVRHLKGVFHPSPPLKEISLETYRVSLSSREALDAAQGTAFLGPRLRAPGGKRRHLYGEVIMPGELDLPLFQADEAIEPEVITPRGPCDRKSMQPPTKHPSPMPLAFDDAPELEVHECLTEVLTEAKFSSTSRHATWV